MEDHWNRTNEILFTTFINTHLQHLWLLLPSVAMQSKRSIIEEDEILLFSRIVSVSVGSAANVLCGNVEGRKPHVIAPVLRLEYRKEHYGCQPIVIAFVR
jgi:hypothetical protein